MEGATGAVTVLAAVVALVVAGIALALAARDSRRSAGDDIGRARQAEFERSLAQLGQRLAVLESDVDRRGSADPAQARMVASAVAHDEAAISHVGLVRFDAFEDTGGGQSFALALLDDGGDGIVLTSLHSRQATRLYVKDIRGGVADAPLSVEEERALRKAGLVL